jgi:hypothetical protein
VTRAAFAFLGGVRAREIEPASQLRQRAGVSVHPMKHAPSLALAALAFGGCAYSNFQTAKMLPPGGTSVTAALSSYGLQADEGGGDEEALEVIVSHGMNEKLELGGKLTWFTIEDADSFNALVIPKYSLVPDTLALAIPAGLVIVTGDNDSDNGWLLMPGLIYTRTLNEYFELDAAAKPVIQLADDFSDNNTSFALNLGVRLTPPGQRWAIFPEVGFMFDDDLDEGYYLHFGIGVSFETGPERAAAARP